MTAFRDIEELFWRAHFELESNPTIHAYVMVDGQPVYKPASVSQQFASLRDAFARFADVVEAYFIPALQSLTGGLECRRPR